MRSLRNMEIWLKPPKIWMYEVKTAGKKLACHNQYSKILTLLEARLALLPGLGLAPPGSEASPGLAGLGHRLVAVRLVEHDQLAVVLALVLGLAVQPNLKHPRLRVQNNDLDRVNK